MTFKPGRKFRKEYDRIFKDDPEAANVLLLLCELANERGEILLETPFPEAELQRLIAARFDDPKGYQLGGSKR